MFKQITLLLIQKQFCQEIVLVNNYRKNDFKINEFKKFILQ